MMNENKIAPAQAHRTLLIIWAALLMSQLLFVVILFVIKPELFRFDLSKPMLGEKSVLILVFAAIGVSNLITSFVYKKKLLDQSVNEQSIGLVQTAMITGCALCESISLLGLMSAFVASYQYFFIFSAVGILGTILHMPKLRDIQAASFRQ